MPGSDTMCLRRAPLDTTLHARNHAAYLFLIVLTFSVVSCGQRAADPVTAAELRTHTTFLASDELQGRLVGSPGIAEAERYIADALSDAGLLPLPGETDYFLDFSLYRYTFGAEFGEVRAVGGSVERTLELGSDFNLFDFSDPHSVEADLVFAGFGIQAPEYGYDDYRDIDATGKAVVIYRYEPDDPGRSGWFNGAEHTSHATFLKKAMTAQKNGAVAVLLFDDSSRADENRDLRITSRFAYTREELLELVQKERTQNSGYGRQVTIPMLRISVEIAELLTGKNARELEETRKRLDKAEVNANLEVTAGMTGSRISIVGADSNPDDSIDHITARNVAGYLKGSTDGWIVFGAHHDHIGSYHGTGDTVFNGADDNASGVSVVLELAEYYASNPGATGYNLAFVTFSAEEQRLFGSGAFAGWVSPENIAFMFNYDMVGRNPGNPITAYGLELYEPLSDAVLPLAAELGMSVVPGEVDNRYFSDHTTFAEWNIPYIWFHTGDHEDYHRVTDHPDLLDYGLMTSIGELTTRITPILDSTNILRTLRH